MDFVEQIDEHRAALKAERQAAKRQLADVDAKLSEYDTAERIWREMNPSVPSADTGTFTGTGKALMLQIVREAYPQGLLSREIRTIARESYGTDLNRTTLTVNMGQHRAASKVDLNGKRWVYVNSETETAPPEQPGGAL